MIKENQELINRLNVLSDGLIVFAALPLAFWVRFYVLPGGIITVPLRSYMRLDVVFTAIALFTYAAFGLYQSFRRTPLREELFQLWKACLLDMALLFSWLFVGYGAHYSRGALSIFFVLSVGGLSCKRYVLRKSLRHFRQKGFNQKHVIILGSGALAQKYLEEIRKDRELGYYPAGYVSEVGAAALPGLKRLGGFDRLEVILAQRRPDEVISAVEMEDFHRTPQIIAACEKAGVRLSIIPFYADYMPSNPQFDDLNGIPLLNIRRIPLDNWANAFFKRAMDVVGAALLLVVTSPLMLMCTIGVRLSSPGPILFRQERIGLDQEPFYMYKFRSMRVNDAETTGWSEQTDSRRTKFGSFMRKCSLDELPQFWNGLKGDMSLVGPRPEIAYYVEQFREEIPLYMTKHQVRPGITGWAQVNDFRGDTSIRARIEYDIYYIEHWSVWFDLQLLWMTVFGGKFLNDEQMM